VPLGGPGRETAVSVRPAVCVALAALALSACQGDADDPEETTVTRSAADPSDLGSKPQVEVPQDEAPPGELVTDDLVAGDGEEATIGSTVDVHYVGVSWSTGQEFDASWDRGQTFAFTLGENRVIAGWEQGVEGMQVGGRRRLIIPPELGYGDRGAGGVIAPGETLVFVVDLLDVS
jgi:peptidylprolyl isomerase